MRQVRRILTYLSAFMIVVIGMLFAIGNPVPTALSFFVFTTPELPLFVWLLSFFLLGCLIGVLLCLNGYVHGKQIERRLKKEIASDSAN